MTTKSGLTGNETRKVAAGWRVYGRSQVVGTRWRFISSGELPGAGVRVGKEIALMNENGPASPMSGPSPSGRPRGVVITYANEPEGQRMAKALVRELRVRGCDAISDHE